VTVTVCAALVVVTSWPVNVSVVDGVSVTAGAGAALPAWLGFMQAAVGGRPAVDFAVPPGVELARVDPETGMLAADGKTSRALLVPFLSGTAPTASSPGSGSAPQNFFQDDR